MYKAIFFDLDGTLTDSYEAIVSSIDYALIQEGITPIEDENVRRSYIGPALAVSFEKHYHATSPQLERLVELYRKAYSGGNMFKVRTYNGVENLLDKLKTTGFRLFIATSKPIAYAVPVLENQGLLKYFEKVAAPDFSNCHITKDCLIKSIMDEFCLEKEECLMVGDTRYDIEGGIAAGVDTLGVTYGYHSPGDLNKATYIADTAEEICRIILQK